MSSTARERGVAAIHAAFARARSDGRAALIPYAMCGYPTSAESIDIAEALIDAGADVLELGMPFSDPLADGPTIQHAATSALTAGADVATCLDVATQLRARGHALPLIFMGYINPIEQYGLEQFCIDAAAAGVDGLLVADVPVEECEPITTACANAGLATVTLVAPTTTPERLDAVIGAATGFVYCVSVAGVTGARANLPESLPAFLDAVRDHSCVPTVVGFGIATPEHVRQVTPHVDGIVFASAIIDRIRSAAAGDGARVASEFVRWLAQA